MSDAAPEPIETPDASGRRVPFWRRPRRLRRHITATLVVTALVSVVLFGALNYVAADRLLLDGTQDQLVGLAETKASSIERSATRAIARVATTASDRSIVGALEDLTAGFDDLADLGLSPEQQATLERSYTERVVDPINELGVVEVALDDVLPTTDAGRWVQYHYTVPDQPAAEPPTTFDEAVADHEAYLTALAATFPGGDVLLIDRDGRIVYTAGRGIDLGTSLVTGPYADGALARLVLDRLDRVRAGDALLSPMSVYVPASARPVLFAAASIRDGTEVIGTLAVRIDVDALDTIVSAGVDVENAGVGDGDSYVVSATGLLQTTPHAWERDPDAYLDDIDDDETRQLVEALGSPTGVQRITTEPVISTVEGDDFVGRTTNGLGRAVYSAATSIDVAGVEWIVVTETPLRDAREPLFEYLKRMAVVVAVIVVIALIAGVLLARRLTRPIPVAVRAARAVAEGERELDLPDLRNDEFGDLGRRLIRTADTLSQQERALDAEFERKRELLLSVLPPHLVRDDGAVSGSGQRVDAATVVSVVIDTVTLDLDDADLADALAAIVDIAERLASVHDVDRVRVAADRSLFVSGRGTPDDGVGAGLAFAADLAGEFHGLSERTSVDFTTHIGVSTGPIAAGVLAQGSLTFAAWGEPVRRALAISALASRDEILVDAASADGADARWTFVAADDVIDLDGRPMDVLRLVLPDADPVLDARAEVGEPTG